MKTVMGLMIALLFSPQTTGHMSGKWTVSMSFHADLKAVLEMKQEGNKVTANLMIPDHGDLELIGEFVDGKLTLKTTENAFAQVTLYGRLKDDGTLTGSGSTTMGDMTWTATKDGAQ